MAITNAHSSKMNSSYKTVVNGTMYDVSTAATPFERLIISQLDAEKSQTILDLGSYMGRLVMNLSEQGHAATGIDIDSSAIAAAKNIVSQRQCCRAQFMVADMENLPFSIEAQYDAVVSQITLQHLGKKGAVYGALTTMRELTNPGGINALKVYLAHPSEVDFDDPRYLFGGDELKEVYQASGWHIEHYKEYWRDITRRDGKTWVHSTADMIARKPTQDLLSNAKDYYTRIDPELAEFFGY